MSTGAFNGTVSKGEAPLTGNGGTILTSYAPDNPLQLSLHQSLIDLMLQSGGVELARSGKNAEDLHPLMSLAMGNPYS